MIFAIKPFEIHDGDGIRTTVFFKGCPLRCKWCHNPESLSPAKELLYDAALCADCGACASLCSAHEMQSGRHVYFRERCVQCGKCVEVCPRDALEAAWVEGDGRSIAQEALRDELFMKESGGGVTFSGGEPLMQPELCVEIARILKERGIRIALDSCGYAPREALERLAPFIDLFLFDIKAVDEGVHRACTGVSNRLILDNIRYADSLGIPMEIRYPYVPGMNSGEADAIGAFVGTLRSVRAVRILPYHDFAQRKYACLGLPFPLSGIPLPAAEEIERAAEAIRKHGVVCLTET